MRKRLSRTTHVLAVLFTVSAVLLPGCTTSNAFKMPSTDWLSWGKKKPASPSFASKAAPNLPAPPSTLASPNTVPSYAQGAGTTSGGYANSPYRAPASGGTTAAPASFGANSSSVSPNTNQGYATAPGVAPGSPPASTYGAPGSSQGFYSPDYRGAPGTAGSSSVYANQPGPAGPVASQGADAYGSYGQSWQGGTTPTQQGWGQGGAQPSAMYGATAGGYGQAVPSASGNFAPYGNQSGHQGYPSGGSAYGGGGYGAPPVNAGPMPGGGTPHSPAVASGGYRPGSTSRATQFGTSDNLNVQPGQSVQPASFAGGGQPEPESSLSAPSPAGGNSYYQDSGNLPAHTATGNSGSYYHPNTYQR